MNRPAAEENQEKCAENFRKTPGGQGTRWHSMLSTQKIGSIEIYNDCWMDRRALTELQIADFRLQIENVLEPI
jgi:hypothetical protein